MARGIIIGVVSSIFEWLVRAFSEFVVRKVSAHVSSTRRTRSVNNVARNADTPTVYGNLELDSHADTVVLGKNCVILAYTGRECDVSPYTDYYDAIKGVPIVTGATAWTSQATGETFILVFNEALWMGE